MVGSVQSLANMEYMLYGNTPSYASLTAPSIVNNYCAQSTSSMYGYPYMNPYMTPYMNQAASAQYNPSFGQSASNLYTAQNNNAAENSIFTGLSSNEQAVLANDYTKSLAPSESFLGATAGAIAFSVLFHPRAIAHPIKTYNSFAKTKEIFGDITKEGSKLCEAWADPKFNETIRDAYTAMNRIDARSLKKDGLHIWRKPLETGEYEELQRIMREAVDGFDKNNTESVKKLMEATERLNQANVKNGLLPRGANWVKNLFRSEKKELPKALDKAKNDEAVMKALADAAEAGKVPGKTYLQTLKTSGGGIKGGLFFLGIEFLTSIGKIRDAFGKDSKTGWAQLGQTTVNGLGSAAGWAAGEALGTWGCAKLLAKAGTKVKPGLGTAIGAIAGMVVGSIGCWFTGKITHKIVGQDVADKVQTENMLATTEGQVQILQNTVQRMQKGEKVDPQAQMAVQKILAQYA